MHPLPVALFATMYIQVSRGWTPLLDNHYNKRTRQSCEASSELLSEATEMKPRSAINCVFYAQRFDSAHQRELAIFFCMSVCLFHRRVSTRRDCIFSLESFICVFPLSLSLSRYFSFQHSIVRHVCSSRVFLTVPRTFDFCVQKCTLSLLTSSTHHPHTNTPLSVTCSPAR